MVADKEHMADEYYLGGQSIRDAAKLVEQTAEAVAEQQSISIVEARIKVRQDLQAELK